MIRVLIINDAILNVDNDEDAQNLLEHGAREIPQNKVKEVFGDYANLASNENTTITEDGKIVFNYVPPTLEEVRQEKLQELETITAGFKGNVNKDMYFTSSLGFKANGDKDALTNSKTLLDCFSLPGFGETTLYYDYDSKEHNLNKTQIQTLYVEIAMYGQSLYVARDAFLEQINQAKTIDQLNKIAFEFPHELPKNRGNK